MRVLAGRRRFARLESLTYSRRAMIATPTPLRTVLFVPGNDRRKIDKALGLGASAVMLDLEDAVAAEREGRRARERVRGAAGSARRARLALGVRINSLASGLADADLDALAGALSRIALITLPDGRGRRRHPPRRRPAGRARAGGRRRRGAVALLAMAETARGILAAREIAESSPRLRTLLFGPGRPRARARRGADRRRLRAPARPLGDRAGGARGRQGGAVDGPYLKLDDDEGCAVSVGLGAAARLSGQGRPAPAPAADRGRRVRARASASSPGRARSTARSARPRRRASPRSSSPTARSSTTRVARTRACATSCGASDR